ncbi:MAG: hypothetical protein FWE91_07025 [Defluviitaleaceae bacterium]|nr:hypothetical protein [Defluviitaleaceae bacterium]MCL2836713.1 hypothetical protein [Defluviitaleaceae bacterium]
MRNHECTIDEINKVKERIQLEGYFASHITNDFNKPAQLLLDIFAKIFVELGEYKPEKYDPRYLPIENHLDKIMFMIGFEPKVEAQFDFSSKTVKISLFILSIFTSLSVFEGLIDILVNNNSMQLDAVLDLFTQKHVTEQSAAEIDKMFEKWKQYSIQLKEENKLTMTWDLSIVNDTEHSSIVFTAIRLIFHHEMAHWHLSRFNEKTRMFYFRLAKNALLNYIQSEEMPIRNDMKGFLTEEVIACWVEEIAADTMSLASLTNRHKHSAAWRRDVYIAIGLYYALLRTQEAYVGKGGILLSKTHPPVSIREEIVLRLLAQSVNMSVSEFIATQAGAWFVYSKCVGIALDNHRRRG